MSNISNLINTSIEDMKSSLDCAESEGNPYSIAILKQALAIVTKRGEKTMAKVFAARIKRYELQGRKK